jgi:hypothetical protein
MSWLVRVVRISSKSSFIPFFFPYPVVVEGCGLMAEQG